MESPVFITLANTVIVIVNEGKRERKRRREEKRRGAIFVHFKELEDLK